MRCFNGERVRPGCGNGDVGSRRRVNPAPDMVCAIPACQVQIIQGVDIIDFKASFQGICRVGKFCPPY